ncbi:MAG: PEP-CTERM sorting domain-containing protein [Thermoguttaceae bacterium]|jgi:hypothetical protein|nr:PEP-CTERM sorting domain-containing protein [Thermoguttaceae bacterium]
MWYKSLTTVLILLAAGLWTLPAGAEAILFQDGFNRGSQAAPLLLSGSAPDVRPGTETWSAPTSGTYLFRTDGNMLTAGGGKAVLPFSPTVPGLYTLQVTADPADNGVDADWISLGFASSTSGNPWDNIGPWMVMRGNGKVTTFTTGTAGRVDVIDSGHTDARPVAIVLDTTSPLWSVEWFVDGESKRTHSFTANPTINYVQLGANIDITKMGAFDNFSLSFVPEPSTWLALLTGMMVLATWRRRG